MARWKLTEAHYINVSGTLWEYTEVDRVTGRPKRTQFPVPLHIDPFNLDDLKIYGQDDPNFGRNADPIIVVCNKNPKGRDILYEGKPTPGMFPLDDEARAISEKVSKGAWIPTAGLDPESQNASYTSQILSGLVDKMTDMKASNTPQIQGMAEFMQMMTQVMAKQTDILAQMGNGGRRV